MKTFGFCEVCHKKQIIFTGQVQVAFCGRRHCLMILKRFEHQIQDGLLHCVLGQVTLLSQCLSPIKCMNSERKIVLLLRTVMSYARLSLG